MQYRPKEKVIVELGAQNICWWSWRWYKRGTIFQRAKDVVTELTKHSKGEVQRCWAPKCCLISSFKMPDSRSASSVWSSSISNASSLLRCLSVVFCVFLIQNIDIGNLKINKYDVREQLRWPVTITNFFLRRPSFVDILSPSHQNKAIFGHGHAPPVPRRLGRASDWSESASNFITKQGRSCWWVELRSGGGWDCGRLFSFATRIFGHEAGRIERLEFKVAFLAQTLICWFYMPIRRACHVTLCKTAFVFMWRRSPQFPVA